MKDRQAKKEGKCESGGSREELCTWLGRSDKAS